MKFIPYPILLRIKSIYTWIRSFIEEFSKDNQLNPKLELVKFSQTVDINAEFLIGTGSGGILYYNKGKLYRILDGFKRMRMFYGITQYQGRWYAFRQKNYSGQIISFCFKNSWIGDIQVEARFLHIGIHQIHAADGYLYIADTPNNRVIRYLIGKNGLKDKTNFYPNGRLLNGDRSNNYVHLNSIYDYNGAIYVVYHNKTRTTDRKSQIAVLNNSLQVDQIINTQAGCVHNIIFYQGIPIYNDSLSGTLMWNNQPIFQVNNINRCFTRGLAVADQLILFGGMDFAQRKERHKVTGYITAFDPKKKEIIGEINIPEIGGITELRLIKPVDYGMSKREVNNL